MNLKRDTLPNSQSQQNQPAARLEHHTICLVHPNGDIVISPLPSKSD